MPLDTQLVELLGRQRLIAALVDDGLEVAFPFRDRGIDLIAYADLSRQVPAFRARPIQMKAATTQRFSLRTKYERISNLLLVYVWNVGARASPEFFAMKYEQAFAVAEASGWTTTPSWKTGHSYSASVGKKLRDRLEPFCMTPERWKPVLRATQA